MIVQPVANGPDSWLHTTKLQSSC